MKKKNLEEVRAHWQDWATQYGTNLRATTKTSTAKALEIDALHRAISSIVKGSEEKVRVLEFGCGNGQNCLSLAKLFPTAAFVGIDYIPAMVQAANELKHQQGLSDAQLIFEEGNILDIHLPENSFDIIFTDRCLINLTSDELQQQAIQSLSKRLKIGGYLLMIENSQATFDRQNFARQAVGLPPRSPADFNHFFDEKTLLPYLDGINLEQVGIEDFISLHDLVLYVLVPMVNGGKVDYDHPMVAAATELNMVLSNSHDGGVGQYGQNRLYKYIRKA